ncbi:uncharacterized protein LOC117223120 [Megalopta genalis]|uniref:uncharacterized protein LOC117223120 n=1 Tax=Megalopta genalis TaxID=115081 RepID=UPI003FD4C540
MASFRPRFQISSFVLQTDSLNGLLLKPTSLTSTILNGNLRSFWFKSGRRPVEYGTGNCGEPAPAKIESLEPCKGAPSKCIEEKPKRKCLFFKKSAAKEKPSNCVVEKPREAKLTLWEQIFGPDPKRSWPDPCTCRIADRQKRKQRREDPRLFDSRYRETAGDVFLFTRVAKRRPERCMEPQPKSPPPFKLPKAVLYGMIGDGCDRKQLEEVLVDQKMACAGGRAAAQLNYRIPYEEMRPPERRRKSFSCREGIRPEDVENPTNEELNFIKAFLKVRATHSQEPPEQRRKDMFYRKMAEDFSETESDVVKESGHKRSRIEQLKMLVQRKSSSQCFFTF